MQLRIKYTGLKIHKGSKGSKYFEGYDSSDSGNVREDFTEFFERELFNHQLNYSTYFDNGMTLDVKGSTNGKHQEKHHMKELFFMKTQMI